MRVLSTGIQLLVIAAMLGCGRPPRAGGAAPERPAAAADAISVYDLAARWTDARGAERPLASFSGKPVVLAMIYTHCSASCPLTVLELQRIARATDAGVGLVLVTLDPARDTPARLAAYAAEHELGPRFTLLTGDPADVRDLAAALGVRYRQLTGDEIAHSNMLTLLDGRGTVVRQIAGIEAADSLAAEARALER